MLVSCNSSNQHRRDSVIPYVPVTLAMALDQFVQEVMPVSGPPLVPEPVHTLTSAATAAPVSSVATA